MDDGGCAGDAGVVATAAAATAVMMTMVVGVTKKTAMAPFPA